MLVRNPNWKAATDYRPAYADKIVWKAGGDPNVLARQTLNSPDLLMADAPPAPVLKTAYEQKKDQLSISTLGNYYAALNTKVPPFDNVNLRRAAVAAADRNAYLLARGGTLVGQVATHFLGPEVPGFQEAGGEKGFGIDFVSHPSGDMTVACKYMKAAGYKNCKYTGNAKVLIVGLELGPGSEGDADRPGRPAEARLQRVDQGRAAADDVLEVLRLREGRDPGVPDGGLDRGLPGSVRLPVRAVQRQGDRAGQQLELGAGGQPADQRGDGQGGADHRPDRRAARRGPTSTRCSSMDAPAIPEIWSSNALLKGTARRRACSTSGTTTGTCRSAPRSDALRRGGPRCSGAAGVAAARAVLRHRSDAPHHGDSPASDAAAQVAPQLTRADAIGAQPAGRDARARAGRRERAARDAPARGTPASETTRDSAARRRRGQHRRRHRP